MMSAINFAVRTAAGSTQLGSVAGESQSNLIAVAPGQSISLNLSPGSVVAYTQQGSDLIVQLMDGRTIVLSNYFAAPAGFENKLFLSSNDEIVEVRVTSGVDGVLFADYGPMQAMEKWSPLDNLRFSESDVLDDALVASNEPAGMAGLIPGLLAGGGTAAGLGGLGAAAAAVAGGAVLLSGGGSGGGGTGGGGSGGGGTGGGGSGGGGTGGGHTPPAIDPRGSTTLNTNTQNPSMVISGTGHPGDTVAVTVNGQSHNTQIGTNGTWNVTLTGPNLPPDGTYVPTVVVTNAVTGVTTPLTGSTYVIDMTPPPFDIAGGTTSSGDVHNIQSYLDSDGVTVLNGTGEPGARMTVVANNITRTAVVAPDGTWSVSYAAGQLPTGDYMEVPVRITSTDVNGNVSPAVNTHIAIDTVANSISLSSLAGDGTVNLTESTNGFTASGMSVPGQTLTVSIGSASHTIIVPDNGQWNVNFGGGVVGADGFGNLRLSSTDAAGNPNVQNHSFRIDTVASVAANTVAGNNVLNAAENGAQIAVTGTAEIGTQSVNVTWGGQTLPATVNPDGTWSVNFPANLFGTMNATNTVMSVQSMDAYGNIGSATRNVTVDTLATVAFAPSQAFGSSINAAEAAAGVNLTGVADAGSRVIVNFEGQRRVVFANDEGNWTANFSLSHLVGAGAVDGVRFATVAATDVNGNSAATQTLPVTIDTRAPDDPFVTGDAGNNGFMTGVITAQAPGDYTYFTVGSTGAAQQLSVMSTQASLGFYEDRVTPIASEQANFSSTVPDGTYLVIRDVDGAGNESSTLYLRSGAEVDVDLTRAGLQGFDFGTINLLSADATLRLDTARVLALTGADRQLTVTGNDDDTVHLTGATRTETTVNSNNETYRLYTLGSGASVLIDEDILVHNINTP